MGGVSATLRKAKKTPDECVVDKRPTAVVNVQKGDCRVLWKKIPKKWEAFDVVYMKELDNKSRRPPRICCEKQPPSLISKEKLLEKQLQAEKNRRVFLEEKKERAAKLAKLRKQHDKDEERRNKQTKIDLKLSRAEENRKKMIENIKTAAKISRGLVCRSPSRLKAEKTFWELEKKMCTTEENRRRIVNEVVRKQRMREEHARNVRRRVCDLYCHT